ncbi:MAG: hypothetical protein AB2A00_19320 [Myxococcota bacterium]
MPPGATLALTSPLGASTSFISGERPGLTVAGVYILRVDLHGDDGSQEARTCMLEVLARAGVTVELTWPTRSTDLDLHLLQVQPDGGVIPDSPADCSFVNCRPGSQDPPPWGNPDAGTSDPVLTLDVEDGYGPERIELNVPPPGQYVVQVHHYAANGGSATEGLVAIELYGQLAAFLSTSTLADGERQDVARITVPDTPAPSICIDDLVRGASTCVSAQVCTAEGDCPSCVEGTCGPGLSCSARTGRCVPAVDSCVQDSDCTNGRVCQPTTQSCMEAQCSDQEACAAPASCQPGQYRCETLPSVCTESDEPNNDPSQATVIPVTLGTGQLTAGTLCRGDVDVAAFAVATDSFAQVTVTLPAADQAFSVQLVAEDGVTPLDVRSASESTVTLQAFYPAGSTGYLFLALEPDATVDQESYTVDVTLEPLPECNAEANEPNESLATAATVSATHLDQATCAVDDEDFFRFSAPANQRILVNVSAASNLTVELLDDQGNTLVPGATRTDFELSWSTGASLEWLVLHVAAGNPDGTFPVPYSVDIQTQAPPSCGDSAMEPNNSVDSAYSATTFPLSAEACDALDDDHYQFNVPTDADVTLILGWEDTTADLDLYVLSADGTAIDAAASSDNPEFLGPLSLVAGDYVVRVQPISVTQAVPYTLFVDQAP